MTEKQHPGEAQLAQFADGQLNPKDTEQIKKHLGHCWQCRTRVEELSTAIAEFIRYRNHFIAPQDVEPPRPWLEIRPHLEELDEKAAHTSHWVRLRARLGQMFALPRIALAGLLISCLAVAWIGYKPTRPMGVSPATQQGGPTAAENAPPTPQPSPSVATPRSKVRQAPVNSGQAPASSSDELRVLASLHRIGADLGDPIEIRRNRNEQIVIRGVGLTPERQAEVHAAVSSISTVRIEFQDAVAVPHPAHEGPVATTTAEVPWQAELDKAFGGRVAVEQVSIVALHQSDAMMARAHALRNLNSRFDALHEQSLSGDDRELLQRMRSDYVRGIREIANQLRRHLGPLLSSDSSATLPMDVFSRAKRADDILNVLFGGARTERNFSELVADLGAHLHALAEAAV